MTTTKSCTQAAARDYTRAWAAAVATGVGLLCALTVPAMAGSFSSAASLAIGRYYHTATTLPNGKVLVAGGNRPSGNSFVFIGEAELYDPATDHWSSAGTLVPPLAYHAATLLPNGKVLLTGGCEPTTPAPPQLYDPATNSWTYAGVTVPLARLFPTATLLADGRVLLVGGRYGSTGPILASAGLFDPGTNTWTPVPDMAHERIQHAATLLSNGKVIVTGGVDAQGERIVAAEVYDPVSNTWSSGGNLAHARDSHSATRLLDQTVLVAAGTGPIELPFSLGTALGELSSSEIYDPAHNSWTSTSTEDCEQESENIGDPRPAGCLRVQRTGHTATLLPDGTVLAAGGITADRDGSLPDGTVLAAGGITADRDGSAEIYHPGSKTWTSTDMMETPRELHAAALLTDGRTLIVGGWNQYNGVGTLASAELYSTGSIVSTLSILRTGAGAGSVVSNPSGIACGIGLLQRLCGEHERQGARHAAGRVGLRRLERRVRGHGHVHGRAVVGEDRDGNVRPRGCELRLVERVGAEILRCRTMAAPRIPPGWRIGRVEWTRKAARWHRSSVRSATSDEFNRRYGGPGLQRPRHADLPAEPGAWSGSSGTRLLRR